ncbi:MAG: SDR family oxidoreductase [Spongiibacteraceae bacterium]
MKRVLLTGSTGFLGGFLFKALLNCRYEVTNTIRISSDEERQDTYTIGEINASTNWLPAVLGSDVVIHCAARAHIMIDKLSTPLDAYREVNTAGTLNLARQAAASGVKRFIFISSIKVNGESTTGLSVFSETNKPAPQDPYGVSKMEAEVGLRDIAEESGMEVVIIRPPLVYGPGVKANFFNLMKLARMRLPLPFAAIHNTRSMVYVGNLVDFIIQCIDHPAAANETFLVSDRRDLSLAELLTLMRRAMGKSPCLLPVPAAIFKLAGAITGKSAVIDRLVGSLQVDSTKAKDLLNWHPSYTVEQGIEATVNSFLQGNK